MDWKVFVEFRPDRLTTYLYVCRTRGDFREFYTKGGTEVVTPKDGIGYKDDLYFAEFQDDSVLSLIVEALDKKGVKAPAQSYIEGKYEATTEHLKDLRKLIPKLAAPKENNR